MAEPRGRSPELQVGVLSSAVYCVLTQHVCVDKCVCAYVHLHICARLCVYTCMCVCVCMFLLPNFSSKVHGHTPVIQDYIRIVHLLPTCCLRQLSGASL